MSDIIKLMQEQPDIYVMGGASEEEIKQAEQNLNLKFDADYAKYVSVFGAASFGCHELTGVCKSKRLNVVDVTVKQWQNNSKIPHNLYVVEELGIDGIVIWQSPDGVVFESAQFSEAKEVCKSLVDFYKG